MMRILYSYYVYTGDFEDAIDTLNLAIGLIKQSVTGNTETSQIIIGTLSDCLRGVEEQSAAISKLVMTNQSYYCV